MVDAPDPSLPVIGATLRVDAAAARVVAAFEAAGVTTLLLKGSTHTFLATPGEHRTYVDVDLLVEPASAARAATVLVELGYRSIMDGTAPSERPDYATTWTRPGAPPVDLHRNLPLVGSSPERVWEVLRAEAVAHDVAGCRTLALSRRSRLLVVAIHAASSGPAVLSSSWDLARALATAADWESVAELASLLDAEPALAAGLRSVPEGVDLADALGLPEESTLALEVRAMSSVPHATSVARFLSTPGLRPRLRLVRFAVAPTPASLRLSTPLARRGRAGLAAAYTVRPLVVLRRLPAAAVATARVARRAQARRRSAREGSGSTSADRVS